MKKGVVIKSTGKWYEILDEENNTITCQIRGKFRMQGIRTTNPISVGDHILYEKQEDDTGVIVEIEQRKNYIIRKSVNLSKEAHIIASNIDLAFLVVSLISPPTSTGFIDRFLITAEAYNIDVCILFNKVDLHGPSENERLEELMELYESIGYECLAVSAVKEQNLEAVKSKMKNKVTMYSGHSGVGKSTLINQIQEGLNIRTADVSDYHQKGTHTTTNAEMHPLSFGGFIIDTPGIKGFGIVDIPKDELHHYFREFFKLLPECKFHNCLHINEPGCAVKRAVEEGDVAISRYENYLMMYSDDENQSYRT